MPAPKTATCNECGASFVMAKANRHICQSEFVAERGMCEDFPCCGHNQGECRDRAEFTSEFWSEYIATDPEGAEMYAEALDMQERGY